MDVLFLCLCVTSLCWSLLMAYYLVTGAMIQKHHGRRTMVERIRLDDVCPKISASRLDPEEALEACCICLGELVQESDKDLEEGEPPPKTLRRLCCGHVFHASCIDAWICAGKPCALCRAPPFDSTVGAPAMAEVNGQATGSSDESIDRIVLPGGARWDGNRLEEGSLAEYFPTNPRYGANISGLLVVQGARFHTLRLGSLLVAGAARHHGDDFDGVLVRSTMVNMTHHAFNGLLPDGAGFEYPLPDTVLPLAALIGSPLGRRLGSFHLERSLHFDSGLPVASGRVEHVTIGSPFPGGSASYLAPPVIEVGAAPST